MLARRTTCSRRTANASPAVTRSSAAKSSPSAPTSPAPAATRPEGKGGSMGPDIKGLGTRKDRNYILESIVAPNKQIAPGFEAATIKLKNNNVLNGVVKSETDTELQMVTETWPR
jgi:hypothetical protein